MNIKRRRDEGKISCAPVYMFVLLSILSLLVIQCAVPPCPVYQEDGQVYGKIEGQWGGRWWNYYQRGFSYAQGGFWDHAASDLKEAVKQRPNDQRRARTYGLHILDDYFPHRELGIVYYSQKRFKDAIEELETSLEQFESAKAKYFLNQARQGFLNEAGLDQQPPRLYISFPKSGFFTGLSKITLRGEATDDQYVSSVSVAGKEIPIELAEPGILFHKDVILKRGENTICVEAVDLVQRKTRQEITLWCDQEAPLIYIDRIEEDPSLDGYAIEGYISDLAGVSGFRLNGRFIELQGEKDGIFSAFIHAHEPDQTVVFEAEDRLGNRTTGEIRISEAIGKTENDSACLPMLAFSGTRLAGMLSKEDAGSPSVKEDKGSAPVIRIKDILDSMTVDWDECFIEGEVRDAEGVSVIKVNGFPLITRTARLVFFNFLVPLDPGDNLITIHTENISGVAVTKELLIKRKLRPVHEIGSRWHIALLPFKYRGDRDELKDFIYESLIEKFVDQGRFRIVAREKIDSLMNKKKGIEDDPIETGRLVSAEGVVAGSAYFFDGHLELIARVIDTETTVVLGSEEVFGPVNSLRDVNALAEGLSVKFKQVFPLVEGRVISEDSDTLQIDIGTKDHIVPYMKVLYFREGEPVTFSSSGKALEKRLIILGEGRISKAYESYSDSIALSKKDGYRIDLGDFVITK
ncbi:tetratricopeptide repeat protein [bacterium]|nr:tetratricopeptide repeat protein [bacterium]